MPAPLAQPTKWVLFRSILNDAAAVLGRVSVVQIASDSSANERADGRRCRAITGSARRIFSTGNGTPMTPVEQTKTSSTGQPRRLAASVTVRSAAASPAAPVAQLAFPAFTTTALIFPFEARRCSLEIRTGAATTRFCVKTAAAEAGTSLEKTARSSAPVFFKPQAVAAKRNPRGSAASERACFMSATFRSPFQSAAVRPLFQLAAPRPSFQSAVFRSPLATATSVALAPRSRKGPPILRSGGERGKLTCGFHAHGFAPVFVAFFFRRASKSAVASQKLFGAGPPG